MIAHVREYLEPQLRFARRNADYFYKHGLMAVVQPGVPGHATRYLNIARTHYETGRMWLGLTLGAMDDKTYPYPDSLKPENCFVHPAADSYQSTDIFGDIFRESETELVQKVKRLRTILGNDITAVAPLRTMTNQGDILEAGGLNPYECLTKVLFAFHDCKLALGMEIQDMLNDGRGGAIPMPPKADPTTGNGSTPSSDPLPLPSETPTLPSSLPIPSTTEPWENSPNESTRSPRDPAPEWYRNEEGFQVFGVKPSSETTTTPSATLDPAAADSPSEPATPGASSTTEDSSASPATSTDEVTPPALPPTSPEQLGSPPTPSNSGAMPTEKTAADYSEADSTGSTTTPTSDQPSQNSNGTPSEEGPSAFPTPLVESHSESLLTDGSTIQETFTPAPTEAVGTPARANPLTPSESFLNPTDTEASTELNLTQSELLALGTTTSATDSSPLTETSSVNLSPESTLSTEPSLSSSESATEPTTQATQDADAEALISRSSTTPAQPQDLNSGTTSLESSTAITSQPKGYPLTFGEPLPPVFGTDPEATSSSSTESSPESSTNEAKSLDSTSSPSTSKPSRKASSTTKKSAGISKDKDSASTEVDMGF